MSDCIKIICACEKHIIEWSRFVKKRPICFKEKKKIKQIW